MHFVAAAIVVVGVMVDSVSGQAATINWTETNCSAPLDYFHYYGDGYCDELLGPFNTKNCGWDGGDCCNTTCSDGDYICGSSGFNCRDPNATDYHNNQCTAAGESVGDGYCDINSFDNDNHLNTALCNWDGGDCCPSTCVGPCDHIVYECLNETAVDYKSKSNCTAPNPHWCVFVRAMLFWLSWCTTYVLRS